ncbi:helix-turn-helix domain-containing protein [Kitasatospora viridis]|uniref:ArsR family transcriptional regulator n=1 Tax=Kitasatospora viridis TaxID=281105 RepID=A0A561UBN4_9ACTN|nr:DUF5937 family protein [Kitasatospora viridis]TWF96765.1 ArsR family transcriptional regulator [Kitasatospora viridis]
MLRFEVGTDDLLHSRFALSPAFELCSLLHALNGTPPHRALPAHWAARLRPVFERLLAHSELAAVLALQTASFGANFIALPPTAGLAQTWADDLAATRATPPATARADIARCLAVRPAASPAVAEVLASPRVVERVAAALDLAWHALLAPDWPQLRAICERDVVHRAGLLGRRGWAAALGGLHSRVRWHEGGIELPDNSTSTVVRLAGEGLLLVPSVLIQPGTAAFVDDPWPKAIVYPARGTAALWESAEPTSPAALTELLGRSRARLLTALAEPAGTTQLARSLGMAPGAVGDHLGVLRRAGLLRRARDGRTVLYYRTPVAEALLGAGEGTEG